MRINYFGIFWLAISTPIRRGHRDKPFSFKSMFRYGHTLQELGNQVTLYTNGYLPRHLNENDYSHADTPINKSYLHLELKANV